MTSLLDQYEQNSQRSVGPVSPPTPVGSDVVSFYYLLPKPNYTGIIYSIGF